MASLGLTGQEDRATVTRIYGERLTVVQEQLVTAQSDSERATHGANLAQLVEAYEYVTGTGRYTQPPTDDGGHTVLRSDAGQPMLGGGDTLVRLETGAVIAGRLELQELLGQGGMGNVYAARDRLKDEDVAIKVLRQDYQFSSAAKERFLAEAKVSCSLSHPNIVRVHDVGISGDAYYLSMERLYGQTLRQRTEMYRSERRPFSVEEVSAIARQLINALRYAHRYIVHRDLKPENIWLEQDDTVKLMDFGIARAFSNSQLTQTGMSMGTAYYMAPEQRVDAKDVDWRADQYALGVVMYELFTGTLPAGTVRPVDHVRPDLPKRYAAAVMRAMSSRPEDRFESLDALLAEMDAPPARRFGVGLLLAGAGVAAAVAAAFVFFGQQSTPTVDEQVAQVAPSNTTEGVQSGDAVGMATPAPGMAQSDAQNSSALPVDVPAAAVAQGGVSAAGGAAGSGGSAGQPPDGSAPGAGGGSVTPPSGGNVAGVAAGGAVASSSGGSGNSSNGGSAGSRGSGSSEPPVPAVAALKPGDLRRQECIAQCERDDGECRSLNRRGRQECMRAVAFGRSGQISASTSNPAELSCGFYGRSRCEFSPDREACYARMGDRYRSCMSVLGGSFASRREDCETNSRESDRMCLDTLQECRRYC